MATSQTPEQVRKLRASVDWAMRQGLEPDQLLPMLQQLASAADDGGEDFCFAHRRIAELGLEAQPWLAAVSVRRVLAARPQDDACWALLGLAYTMMGHYRAAVGAYRRARTIAPSNPWYAHNLGHLLDIALGRPAEAVPHLASALRGQPREVEMAASYAHALGRVGRAEEARRLFKRYLGRGATQEHKALMRALEKAARLGAVAQPDAAEHEDGERARARRSSEERAASRRRTPKRT
jgi:Flp pilus assembly protein TadD